MEMKERIQHKAQELFRRYGIKSVTMDEIATQLGVSKKTIYQFYSDKDELVLAVANFLIKFTEHNCSEHCSHAENAIEEIFQAMDFGQRILEEINPAMLFDLEKYHPEAFKNFQKHKNGFMKKMLDSNLQRGIREELFRPEINIDVLTKFRLETMLMVLDQDIFPQNRYKFDEVHRELMEHFLYGIASQKGIKLIQKYKQRYKSAVNEK
jgi:TetR/AcrR family transcriptional regulator, cholesterol catabolism regulator